jgi:hypothetical protein
LGQYERKISMKGGVMRKLRSALVLFGSCCLAIALIGVTPALAGHGNGNGGGNGHGGGGNGAHGAKVCLCHVPPGDPADEHTICVGAPAVRAHLAHGDFLGECPTTCGGSTGLTCPADQFCKHDTGLCGPENEGVCTPKPASCECSTGPVCGCDGMTYDNSCLADAAGVNVLHAGACVTETACGGDSSVQCAADEFCKKDEGACAANAQGTCAPLPPNCPATLTPVCGCDGETYSNSCLADAAGVTVDHDGPCQQGAACGGTGGATCATGEFCKPPDGDCAAGAPGNCQVMPTACSKISDPVCGCDGKTYANPCLADAAGVAVDHDGPCPADVHLCGGAGGAACGTGQFCDRPEGACAPDAPGVCKDSPSICPPVVDPVCGCNGQDYSSPCIADAVGVTVDHEGSCEPPRACGGDTGTSCLGDQFCKAPAGVCASGAAGVCANKPALCPPMKDPVCGCDGMTYDNACFADAAGVVVNHTGACTP